MQTGAENLSEKLLAGDNRALAKAITLTESSRPEDRELAKNLLSVIEKTKRETIRIGISGAPGAGKSTFIEAFGLYIISLGNRVAVLAVDPSSPVTGGSILGDKTRMPGLAQNKNAFIRPSPSGGTLGGVARRTRESIRLCEAAGYNVILVETVGVGQSEVAVSEMTDLFLLLLIAGAGDELQGIKKGIMELSDIILVNKADGKNKLNAENARSEFKNALSFVQPKYDFWSAPVNTVSAINGEGIKESWDLVLDFIKKANDLISKKREIQNEKWLWQHIEEEILDKLNIAKRKDKNVLNILEEFRKDPSSLEDSARKIVSLLIK
ncbi:MAG: methylmalonyl Co-A mutase-associated GTPase MeaB [Leptospira sp.]|nr:methylmalonyl Co-A mutase-associated GTPase MeaB [Leptospira sp.]